MYVEKVVEEIVRLIHSIESDDVVPTRSDIESARNIAAESVRNGTVLAAGLYALLVRHQCVLPPACTRCDALTTMTKLVEGALARHLRYKPSRFEEE